MINKVIKRLILSDVTLFFSIGLLLPIFAIYVTSNIEGGTLRVVGLAASMYWISRTIFTVPISKYMDRTKGELDEYAYMLIGLYVMTLIPLFYIWSNQPWHIYLLGFINGLAGSMAIPGWRILFTNHIDKGKTGYEWSIEDVGVGIAIAISSYLGAFLADTFGFDALLILITVVGMAGVTVFIAPLYREARVMKKIHVDKRIRHKQAPRKIDTIK